MQVSISAIQSIKIQGTSMRVHADVSVDTDDDGKRNVHFPRLIIEIPPTLEIVDDEITYTVEQVHRIVSKLAGKAARTEARRLAKLDDDMPTEEVE